MIHYSFFCLKSEKIVCLLIYNLLVQVAEQVETKRRAEQDDWFSHAHWNNEQLEQAGAELGQAHLKLRLDFP